MDKVQTISGGNNDRREVENRSTNKSVDDDDVAKGIIHRIQSGIGEDANDNIEKHSMFPEEDLEVENLEVPENDS